jgi:hypothetical protein
VEVEWITSTMAEESEGSGDVLQELDITIYRPWNPSHHPPGRYFKSIPPGTMAKCH